ncbi:MAG: SsrA-binding protein SmpB [Spirochaetes bacterium]|nr:SsrA-binding protein SmpB [Spirochaetota bacterium]
MENIKIVHRNKKAFHDYEIIEKYEAGIVLKGTEIKSIREGNCNLKDSYAKVTKKKEVYLYGFHISEYKNSGYVTHDPLRPKKLLLNKREILKLSKRTEREGYTLIALSIYLKNNKAKVELAVAKGKKIYDKRDDIKDREIKRSIEREVKKWH